MARWLCSLAALFSLALLCAGCATNRPGDATASSNATTGPASGKPAEDEAAIARRAERTRNRIASRNRIAEREALAARTGKPGSDVPRKESTAQVPPRSTEPDPAMIAYIEQELRDASPEERADLSHVLQGQHPDAVRLILRARRAGLQRQQQELSAARLGAAGHTRIQTASADSAPAIRDLVYRPDQSPVQHRDLLYRSDQDNPFHNVAANERPSERPAEHSSAEGLGTVSAWDRHAPATQGNGSGFRADGGTANSDAPGYAAIGPTAVAAAPVNTASGQRGSGPTPTVQTLGADAFNLPTASGTRPNGADIGTQPNAAATAGTPASVPPGPEGTRDALARLIAAAEAETSRTYPGETELEKQAYIEKQVYLRMLYLMAGQQERALQAIPGVAPADQEFWQQTFWGLTNYFDVASIPSPAERAAQTVSQLTSAVVRLQEKANLELKNVTFCPKISGFGNYEKYPHDEFSPGQDVLLYADLANVHSEPVADGKFRTSLKSTIEICREGRQGELVDRIDLAETVDICRTHRRDYFHSYQFTIPTKLTPGRYVLKLSVEDQLNRRVAVYPLNFTVK